MGYTRFFTNKRDLDDAKFRHFSYLCKKITELTDIPIEGVETNEKFVKFNGVGEDGHERFYFKKTEGFNFCKTQRKPYDELVCACLDIAKNIFKDDVEISGSDNQDMESILKYKKLMRDHKIDKLLIK